MPIREAQATLRRRTGLAAAQMTTSPELNSMPAILSAAQLEHFKRLLRDREQQLRGQLQTEKARAADEQFSRIASEAPDREDASLADVVIDVNQAAIGRDSAELRMIGEALGRIAAGGYGVCLRCGKPIELARLELVPAARYDARCQALHEREDGEPRTPTI